MYKKTIFKNGLRLITVPNQQTKTVTILVLVGAGSKYERKELNGISHFLEHMFFKGTKKRPNTLKIAETLDRVGGIYNAFTGKEFTGYFAKVSSGHLDLALDWVSDIFLNSTLKEKEVERAKGVIIEELNMYLDTPTRFIEDCFERLLYGDQPAGWNILGGKENIQNFQKKHLINYLKDHYSALNTVVAVAGDFDPKLIEKKIKKHFKRINKKPPKQKIKVFERQDRSQSLLHFKKTDQTHLCLGVKACDLFDKEKYTQEILATILGGNMSSRLFILIREKKGLAYYIDTDSQLYTDTGYVVTQAGVPHRKVEEVISLILREYKCLKERKISEKELQKAKDYLKGTSILSLEPSDAQASFYALQEVLSGEILTPKEKFVKIDEVTINDVQKLAQSIFREDKLNLAIIGPHKDKEEFQKLLSF